MDYYKSTIPILDFDTPEGRDLAHPRDASYGLIPRDYATYPAEMFDPPSGMQTFPESSWDAIYDEQEEQKSSMEHLYLSGAGGAGVFENLDQNGHGYCLIPGTMVLLADGTEKAVETFRGGEQVITHTGRARKVIRPTSRKYTGQLVTVFPPGDVAGKNRQVTATSDHPFLTPSGDWVPLAEIAFRRHGGLVYNGHSVKAPDYPVTREVKDEMVHCLEVEDDHSFIADGFTVHNCWAYSTGHALMLMRLVMNQPLIRLNPHATAAIIKRGRDEGGWNGLSAKWAREHGYAVEGSGPGQWPLHSRDLRYDTPELRTSMALHKSTEEWVDLTRDVYDVSLTRLQYATALMLRLPCPSDYSHWGHSVCAVRWVRIERGSWGTLILNSWRGWGRFGLGVLQGSKALPESMLAIRQVRPAAA